MLKSQKTMDDFFKNPSSSAKYEIKRYFYLIWENKYKPNVQAYWTDTRPQKVNFIEQVSCNYIKKGYYFYICGYFSDYEDKSYYLTKEKVYKNVPYLKSHLQKCIRKCDDLLAIPTCFHLFKLDLNELLRRLPIIMIEDVMLHESYSTLLWLMIANSTNKFKMKIYIYEWILGAVYVLCKIETKDAKETKETKEKDEKNILDTLNSYNKDGLSENELSLLYCMHMRIAYGGMDCDLKMIKESINIWKERFIDKSYKVNNMEIRPVSIYVKELSLQDWDISAIDYHCNSKILDHISKKYDEITSEEIKKVIWYHSSSINNRVKNDEYNNKLWNEIKNYVEKTQKYLLDSSH
jgi:hypothetical protein